MLNDGLFTIVAAGNIWNPDSGHYVYQKVDGDFVFEATLEDLEHVDQWTKGGLMVGHKPGPKTANAYIYGSPDWGVMMQARKSDGADPTWLGSTPKTPLVTPVMLRMTKVGNTITGEFSHDDGATWTEENSVELEITGDVYVSLAVAVTTPTEGMPTTTAAFSKVSITPLPPAGE